MKVLTVVGARPQFIKAFAVSNRLREHHEEVLIHTGQHYDEELSEIFFEELGIPEPEYNLGVGSGTHAGQTATTMQKLDPIVADEEPDVILVYGDTNSTLAAALVAAKRPVTLAHVEAGLRSYNRDMPEEINRVLTDHASDLLFAPTETAVETLAEEGITTGVHNTGDVMFDTLEWARSEALARSTILETLDVSDGQYILATVHRAGNTDDPARLAAILDGLASADVPVVLPAHPRTVDRLQEHGLYERARDVFILTDPVGYLDFVRLMIGADRVVTDSGGVQKEAFLLDIPCITLREETEWVVTVEAGLNVLVGADAEKIREALKQPFNLDSGSKPEPYGDGTAAETIVRLLASA